MKKINRLIRKCKDELTELINNHKIDTNSRDFEVIFKIIVLLDQIKKCKFLIKDLTNISWILFLEGEDWHKLKLITSKKRKQYFSVYMDENNRFFLYIHRKNENDQKKTKIRIELNLSDFRRNFKKM